MLSFCEPTVKHFPCVFLSLPVISLHLHSCHLVSSSFASLSFPLHSPCFHFFPLHVPFSSPSFPFPFPVLSCHVVTLPPACPCIPFMSSPSFPRTSLRFPFARGSFPKKHNFSNVFAERMSKTGVSKTRISKELAGGFKPGSPKTILVERQRGTWGAPPRGGGALVWSVAISLPFPGSRPSSFCNL